MSTRRTRSHADNATQGLSHTGGIDTTPDAVSSGRLSGRHSVRKHNREVLPAGFFDRTVQICITPRVADRDTIDLGLAAENAQRLTEKAGSLCLDGKIEPFGVTESLIDGV